MKTLTDNYREFKALAAEFEEAALLRTAKGQPCDAIALRRKNFSQIAYSRVGGMVK